MTGVSVGVESALLNGEDDGEDEVEIEVVDNDDEGRRCDIIYGGRGSSGAEKRSVECPQPSPAQQLLPIPPLVESLPSEDGLKHLF